MSLETPSTEDISDNIIAQLEASLEESIPFFPKSFLNVLAKVLAGVFILLWKYVGWVHLQMFVATASTKEVTINGRTLIPLVEWGRLLGVGDPIGATRAILDVTVTVTNQTGAIAGGTQLIRSQTGVLYTATAPKPLDASTVLLRIRAASDQTGGEGLGTLGNLQVADVLSFASPLPNVVRDVVVAAQVVTAEDAEGWEAYRSRILERASAKPQGGAKADYRIWARAVPGIVAVYPDTGDPGEVDVFVEASVASSGSADGIPTSPQLTAVAAAIDLDVDGVASRRPANAAVNVLPITRSGFTVKIYGLSGSSTLEQAITDALASYYAEREPFILGLSVLPRKDRVLQSTVIGIVDELVNIDGGTVGTIEQFYDGAETPVYSLLIGEKAKLEEVQFL